MKMTKIGLLCLAAALMGIGQAKADIYVDAPGDTAVGPPILDILQVEVINDATDITFNIGLAGDIVATDWGKYMIGIDSVPGGDVAGNGWARPISMPSGMDYWIGSWADSGNGAETYSWDGAVWNLDNATYSPPSDIQVPTKPDNFTLSVTTTLSSLGLGIGDTFVFDVFSSGGNPPDSAIDALSDPGVAAGDWGTPYSSSSTLTYTVIPEPATIGLIGVFGIGMLIARRRR